MSYGSEGKLSVSAPERIKTAHIDNDGPGMVEDMSSKVDSSADFKPSAWERRMYSEKCMNEFNAMY